MTPRLMRFAAAAAVALAALTSPTLLPAGPAEKSPVGRPDGPPPQVTVVWPRKDGTPIIHYAQHRWVRPSDLRGGDIDRREGEQPRPVRLPTVNGRVLIEEMVEAPVDGKSIRAYGLDGKEIDPKDVRARVKGPTAALLSLNGKPVDPFYLRLAKEGTLVLVGPTAVDTTAARAASPPSSIRFPGGLPKGR